MSKLLNDIVKTHQTNVNVLKQNISGKMNSQDELVKTYNLYGVFSGDILGNNTFTICAETLCVFKHCSTIRLSNFFDNAIITEVIINDKKDIILPWNNEKTFVIGGYKRAIAFPIEDLLTKNCLNGITTKRNLTVAQDVINEYLKEHTNFVQELFIQYGEKKFRR